MSLPVVNLAHRAFVNSRLVVRVTVLLWVAGLLALVANVWLYRSYFVGSSERARRLAEIEEAISGERQRIAELEVTLSGMNLARQNETVRFLNQKIAQRSFAWSRLFDHLAEVLPGDMRLQRLNPEGGEATRRPGLTRDAEADGGPRAVSLVLSGEARTDEALLTLVDRLFEHPAFRDPNLQREARAEGARLRFDLTVDYLPEVEAAEEPLAGELPAAGGGGEEGEDESPSAEQEDEAAGAPVARGEEA
jgi:Tfp pilus assembly protein PilN